MRHELLQVIEALKVVANPFVVHVDVFVDQHVTEADRPRHGFRRRDRHNPLCTERAHGIGVGLRDTPSLRDDEVMRNPGATLDGLNKMVFRRRKPGGIAQQAVRSDPVPVRRLQIGRDAVEHAVEPLLINHQRLGWPAGSDAGGSAPG